MRAIEVYDRVAKVVQPKKERLKQAELVVKEHMQQLETKRQALQVTFFNSTIIYLQTECYIFQFRLSSAWA